MRTQSTRALSESQRLHRKIALVFPELAGAGSNLVSHQRAGDLFAEYLFTLHCIIRASVSLMETALQRARSLADGDPVAAGVAAYLAQHIEEELDHDEWLLSDLEVLGSERDDILARPPPATVAALVGAQYYWILHYHPIALLGYIALLEGYPPTAEELDYVMARTGCHPDAFRTLRKHGELDPHHRKELDETLDGLDLTQEQAAMVGLSAIYTAHMLACVLDEIADGATAA